MNTKIINVLDLVLQDIMRMCGESLTFVQIGAHDGMHLDPIYPYVIKHGWRGVLVEPQPRVFRKLKHNYDGIPNLEFENVAIYHQDGPVELTIFKDETLHAHSTMLASFIPQAISGNSHGYAGEAMKLKVKGITLHALFQKHQISRLGLDVLQIDCEGFDHEILKMLAQTPVRPFVINFESAFYGQQQMAEIYALLTSLGYRVATYGIDTIAMIQVDDYPRVPYKGMEGIV